MLIFVKTKQHTMIKLILDFEGYSEIDKNDLVVERIEDSVMVQVDVSNLSGEEIVEQVKNGDLYINFIKTYSNTLDGSIDLTLTLDK